MNMKLESESLSTCCLKDVLHMAVYGDGQFSFLQSENPWLNLDLHCWGHSFSAEDPDPYVVFCTFWMNSESAEEFHHTLYMYV